MTGFESKRQMAQDKLTDDDDDTQVYADTLLIVYQRGFADGKRAAERKPLSEKQVHKIWRSLTEGEGIEEFARAIERAHNIKEQP